MQFGPGSPAGGALLIKVPKAPCHPCPSGRQLQRRGASAGCAAAELDRGPAGRQFSTLCVGDQRPRADSASLGAAGLQEPKTSFLEWPRILRVNVGLGSGRGGPAQQGAPRASRGHACFDPHSSKCSLKGEMKGELCLSGVVSALSPQSPFVRLPTGRSQSG